METLLDGVNHIALLTRDMDRFIRFYQEVFDAQVVHDNRHHAGHVGERMVIMALGGQSAFNVFEVPGNTQAQIQTPMFGRGRLDHFGLNVRSRETFEQARRLCRKFAFLRPNPKIGYQKINGLRD